MQLHSEKSSCIYYKRIKGNRNLSLLSHQVSGLTLNPQLSLLATTSSLKTRRCFKEHHQIGLGTPSLVLASRLPAGPNQVPQTHLVVNAEVWATQEEGRTFKGSQEAITSQSLTFNAAVIFFGSAEYERGLLLSPAGPSSSQVGTRPALAAHAGSGAG